MARTSRIAIFFAIAHSLYCASIGRGDDAFDSLEVCLNPTFVISDNTLGGYWQSGMGFEGAARLPFYFGRVGLSVSIQPFRSLSPEQPDFNTILTSLLWENGFVLYGPVSISLGGRIGLMRMMFEQSETELIRPLRIEHEVTAGIFSRLGVQLPGRWNLFVTSERIAVFTHRNIDVLFFSLGVSRRFVTPVWLKDFLR